MKRGLAILLFAIVLGLAAYVLVRCRESCHPAPLALDALPELDWLRQELELNDEQFAKVKTCHLAYKPTCASLCARINEARQRLDTLARDHKTDSTAMDAAIQNHAAVRADCEQAMLAHVYETARLMDEDQSERYLKLVLPHVAHTGFSCQCCPPPTPK